MTEKTPEILETVEHNYKTAKRVYQMIFLNFLLNL